VPRLNLLFPILLFTTSTAFAQNTSVRQILQKVSERYSQATLYELSVHIQDDVSLNARIGNESWQEKLYVSNSGKFRVESDYQGQPELMVSDGENTWKSLPAQKIWSHQSSAAKIGVTGEEEDDFHADLFSTAYDSFVKRYILWVRFADQGKLVRETRVKVASRKYDCYELHFVSGKSTKEMFVDKDSFLVVRLVETFPPRQVSGGSILERMTLEMVDFSTDVPASVFAFAPPPNGREVNSLLLPGERDLSLAGQKAVDFALPDSHGSQVRLADLKGKIVLLDFWATWCPPCRAELPVVAKLSNRFADRGLVVLGINDEGKNMAQRYLDEHHQDLAVLLDADGKVHRAYRCTAIPEIVIIDRGGTVVAHLVGGQSEDVLITALKQAGL